MSITRAFAFPAARAAYASRAFTTTSVAHKTLTDSVKETADAVNKKVGQTLASGLGKAEEAAESAKKTVSDKTPSKVDAHVAAEKAQQSAKSAGHTANQKLDQAAGKARHAKANVEKKI
ncbi:hypothetical protein DB88DRAFT_357768 [Papiliotrema laurentii]|uniref:Uncharacterized protein n=1 Tax=Papiliotrema laurentii TaxID=5418 RepID=A0AAD9CY20_PAPLA|nr:hypothetical protein DB88DRAFT_357768 [Papiliotrema laurentii]